MGVPCRPAARSTSRHPPSEVSRCTCEPCVGGCLRRRAHVPTCHSRRLRGVEPRVAVVRSCGGQPSRVEPCLPGIPFASSKPAVHTLPVGGVRAGRNRKPFPASWASWCPVGRRSGSGTWDGRSNAGQRVGRRTGGYAGAVSARVRAERRSLPSPSRPRARLQPVPGFVDAWCPVGRRFGVHPVGRLSGGSYSHFISSPA